MKRFVVIINEASKEQQDKLSKHFSKGEKYGWWHWFQDAWLLTSNNDDITARKIRDEMLEEAPETKCLVLEAGDNPYLWAGFGTEKEFEWLHTTWVGKKTPHGN